MPLITEHNGDDGVSSTGGQHRTKWPLKTSEILQSEADQEKSNRFSENSCVFYKLSRTSESGPTTNETVFYLISLGNSIGYADCGN